MNDALVLANTGDVLDGVWQLLCTGIGFVLISAWALALAHFVRNRRVKRRGGAGMPAVALSIAIVFWAVLAWTARPPFPASGTDAAYKVHTLSEVEAMGSRITSVSGNSPSKEYPFWEFTFYKIETDGQQKFWHRFRTHAYEGSISVQSDEGGTWESIEEWRRTRS